MCFCNIYERAPYCDNCRDTFEAVKSCNMSRKHLNKVIDLAIYRESFWFTRYTIITLIIGVVLGIFIGIIF